LARSPQGHPVIFQAGDSPTGRDFAAANADVIFSGHGTHFDDALAFANDIRARLLAAGRPADDIKILPGTQIVLAEKASEVEDKRRWCSTASTPGQTALSLVGQVWGVTSPIWTPMAHSLPTIQCLPPISVTRGAARDGKDRSPSPRTGGRWPRRRTSRCARWSSKRRRVRGSWGRRARSPTSSPGGCAQARPTLQHLAVHRARRPRRDRRLAGARTPGTRCYRTEYTSTTLRGHLGLREPLTRRQNTETDGSAAVRKESRIMTPPEIPMSRRSRRRGTNGTKNAKAYYGDPLGWVSITGLYWLTDEFETVADLPVVGGRTPRPHTSRVSTEPSGSSLPRAHPDCSSPQAIGASRVIRRTGTVALRVHDPKSPHLEQYDGIPTYAPSEQWHVSGTFVRSSNQGP